MTRKCGTVKRLLGLLEPLLILVMALMVGFIVISIVLALFSINEFRFKENTMQKERKKSALRAGFYPG